jgi:hypothetical protein
MPLFMPVSPRLAVGIVTAAVALVAAAAGFAA